MEFSSYLISRFVLDDVDERLAPEMVPVPERLEALQEYCAVMDGILLEHGGEIETVVNEDLTVSFRMTLDDLEVNRKEKIGFQLLAERAVGLRFAAAGEDKILVELTFPSLWERAE